MFLFVCSESCWSYRLGWVEISTWKRWTGLAYRSATGDPPFPVADPGGGGGVRTPPFGPWCRLFNIGPKVGPPFFACRPKMQRRIRGGGQGVRAPPLLGHDVGFLTLGPKLDPPFLLVDLRGGGCLWMSKSGGVFQFFGGGMMSRGQCPRGGACECLHPPPPLQEILYPRLRWTPPFKNPGSAPDFSCKMSAIARHLTTSQF